MHKGRTLLSMWATFRHRALPPGLDEQQVHAARLTFYAGLAVMFDAITKDVDSMEEDEAMKYLSALDRELQDFAERERRRQSANTTGKN